MLGKVGGVRGEWGWNLYLNEVFNKTGIVSSELGVGTHIPEQNQRDSPIFWEINIVMTSRSRKYVIISPKKSKNENARDFTVCDCAIPRRCHGHHVDFCLLQIFKCIF